MVTAISRGLTSRTESKKKGEISSAENGGCEKKNTNREEKKDKMIYINSKFVKIDRPN